MREDIFVNAIERLNRYLEGKPVDRTPNLNIIMQFAAKYVGVPYGVYCTDHRYLVEMPTLSAAVTLESIW